MAQTGQLVSGAAWNISGKVVQLAVSLVSLSLIARLVGPEVWGVFALGWLVVGIFDIFVSSAPTDTLVQRQEVSAGHFNATLILSLSIALLVVAAIWFSATPISNWLGGGEMLAAILPLRAAVLPVQAVAVGPTALLLRTLRFRALAGAELTASVTANVVGMTMAVAGYDIWSLVGMELTRVVVLCGAVIVMTRWRPGIRANATQFGDLFAFNASTWGSWGLAFLNSQLPRLLIAKELGVQAVGVYALAQRLYELLNNIVMVPTYQVVQAGISRAQDDRDSARRLTRATLQVTGVVACPLFLGLAALAPVLVPTAFGAAWTEAIPIVQLLMLLGLQSSMSIVQSAVVRGMGKPHWDLMSATVVVAMTASFLVIALPYGLMAATVAVVLSNFLIWPLDAVFVRRLTRLSVLAQVAAVSKAGVAALLMALAVWALSPSLLALTLALALPVLMGVGAVLYWILLRLLMPAAATIIESIVMALVRRDFAALRATLASLSD